MQWSGGRGRGAPVRLPRRVVRGIRRAPPPRHSSARAHVGDITPVASSIMLVKDLARELVEVRRRDAPVRGARAPSSRVRSFFSNLNRRLVRRLTIPPSVPSQSDRVKEALENFKDAFARAKKESSADGAEAKEVLAAIDEIARVIPADDVCARFARAIAHGESPSPFAPSARDGKYLKPVRPSELRMTCVETAATLLEAGFADDARWRDVFAKAVARGVVDDGGADDVVERDGDAGLRFATVHRAKHHLALARSFAYRRRGAGRLPQALIDAKAGVAYAPDGEKTGAGAGAKARSFFSRRSHILRTRSRGARRSSKTFSPGVRFSPPATLTRSISIPTRLDAFQLLQLTPLNATPTSLRMDKHPRSASSRAPEVFSRPRSSPSRPTFRPATSTRTRRFNG